MSKTILITGSTDGIGLEAAKQLADAGHDVILHGRNPNKLSALKETEAVLKNAEVYQADLSDLTAVEAFADQITKTEKPIDVLINNAGVFHIDEPTTADGLDVRFVVNSIAPFLLTRTLLPSIKTSGRIINVSSAAQSAIDLRALNGEKMLSAGEAYAQSKLAITMWSFHLANSLFNGPAVISVNPGSFLGTKMVKESYGMAGKDIQIGADILAQLAVDANFENCSGQYFDNDIGRFGPPHPDAHNLQKTQQLVRSIEMLLTKHDERNDR